MILYGDSLNPTTLPRYDICIAGCGAVAFAMVNALKDWAVENGKRIVVLESGRENIPNGWNPDDPDPKKRRPTWGMTPRFVDSLKQIRDIDKGKAAPDSFLDRLHTEFPYERDFFTRSRTRCYGGSTNCWGGFIRPLDAYDFNSWSISYVELVRHYKSALQLVNLENFDLFDKPKDWKKLVDHGDDRIDVLDEAALNKAGLKTVVIQQQTDTMVIDFQERYASLFSDDPNNKYFKALTLIRNATAIDCFTSPNKNLWQAVQIQCGALSPDGSRVKQTFKVWALHHVLAMGGLEIPRLLLHWKDKYPQGPFKLNNLGKFYMGHPKYEHLARGTVKFPSPIFSKSVNWFLAGDVPLVEAPTTRIQAFIVPTEDALKKNLTKNFRMALGPEYDGDNAYTVNLEINFEQVPNELSQIRLKSSPTKDEIDAFGIPCLELDWRFQLEDQHTVNNSIDIVTKDWMRDALNGTLSSDWDSKGEYGKGKVNWLEGDYPPVSDIFGRPIYTGDHHMGTCRMVSKNGAGAVGTDCKVVGFNNFWICSDLHQFLIPRQADAWS